jgi:aspartyl-tRNA(Asn)/glutamyl-tRNA(Gln) amidotransferase subunit B
VCLGMPGSLPVLNREAVSKAIRMGVAVGCSIAPKSVFARKNYFYPDLPKGYQISQYDKPLCVGGAVDIRVEGVQKTIRLTRIHLEEDAGKLIHDQSSDTLFDVNRCGTPLIEIVTEPDLRSPAEACAYFTAVKQILEYLGVCDCNMEEGSLRCDANVSLRPRGQTKLGTKAEIKNMNSFRGVEKALEYEIRRQREVLESGGTIVQQTYLWDPNAGRTVPMRDKEDAHDYRYFPDPDLVPVVVEPETVTRIRSQLPELPGAKRNRFSKQYGLTENQVEVLTDTPKVADYFERTAGFCSDVKLSANWVMTEILRLSKEKKVDVDRLHAGPKRLGALLTRVVGGAISAQAAKKVIDLVEERDIEPSAIIQELGLEQVSDTSAIEVIVENVLSASEAEIGRYKAGEIKLLGFFVGQVMKEMKGKGNPKEINRIVGEKLARR